MQINNEYRVEVLEALRRQAALMRAARDPYRAMAAAEQEIRLEQEIARLRLEQVDTLAA
jgi:hypothetical protein